MVVTGQIRLVGQGLEKADCLVAEAEQVMESFLASRSCWISTLLSLEHERLQRVGRALSERQSWMVVTGRVKLVRSRLGKR